MTSAGRLTPLRPIRRVRTVTWRILGAGVGSCLMAVLLGAVGSVGAASSSPEASLPTPSASPATEPHHVIHAEAWLDVPLPATARAGSTIAIGMTVIDVDPAGVTQLSHFAPTWIQLSPATGDGAPTRVTTRSDWPGHVLADVPVPDGGPGTLSAGAEGRECSAGGDCRTVDLPYPIGGVGPPPGVPVAGLVTASVQLPADAPIVGQPLALEVDITPRADWGPSSLAFPDRAIANVNQARGPDVVTTELIRSRVAGLRYTGSITLPAAGNYVLAIAFPGENGQEDQVLAGSTTRLVVVAAVAGPVVMDRGGSSDTPPWPWIAGLGLVAIAAGLLISRVFADL